ncbi:MAG TPA: hypothetical protein VJT71_05040 [Pyrinomonadaceae bacterium]|nr:hypothetical protein [Pyrinomonadaceae bacterium]
MKKVRAILLAMLVGSMVSAGAFAQKGGGNSNRPPKEDEKIKEKDKPPPSNSNKRGKP